MEMNKQPYGYADFWLAYVKSEPKTYTMTYLNQNNKIIICVVDDGTKKIVSESTYDIDQAKSVINGLEKAVRLGIEKLAKKAVDGSI